VANEELLNEFENRELETMAILLTASAQKTAITLEAYVESRLLQGASAESIREALLTDLNEGGRMFSEFRRSIRSTAVGSVNRVSDAGLYSEWGVDREYRWSAVLINTCDDCLSRHGIAKTWDEWESLGLPRSGSTICRSNCHCQLLIAEAVKLEPIRRKKK